jgi:osmotically-inducible protein OsmY
MRDIEARSTPATPRLDIAEVHFAIERALERLVDREAGRIHVAIRDGRVILHGAVRSWAERRAVIGAVRGTPGVRSVEDHLLLQPYA